MYKMAMKEGYLFKTNRGMITTQDLFALPLTGNNGMNLDEAGKSVIVDIKAEGEESLVSTKTHNPINANKLAILKDVIADKIAEKDAKKDAKLKAAKKTKLLEILARKQDASLEEKTEAEILAELEALG